MAQKALREVRKVRRDEELKYYETGTADQDGIAVSSTGFMHHLSVIPQGDGASSRDGNKIRIKELKLRGKFWTILNSNVTYRVIVFVDKRQVYGTPTTVSELLVSARTNATLDNDNVFQGRFKILMDRTFDLNTAYVGQDHALSFNKTIKCDIGAEWVGTGSADISKNQLYMCLLCDTASSGGIYTAMASGEVMSNIRWNLKFTDS